MSPPFRWLSSCWSPLTPDPLISSLSSSFPPFPLFPPPLELAHWSGHRLADLNTKDQIMLGSPAPDKISPLIKAGWPETLLDHFAL